jgi:hypothetical protein
VIKDSPPWACVSRIFPTKVSISSPPQGKAYFNETELYKSTKGLILGISLPLLTRLNNASTEALAPFLVLNF